MGRNGGIGWVKTPHPPCTGERVHGRVLERGQGGEFWV